jgi:O-antigen/teichoic acid export membrane protein
VNLLWKPLLDACAVVVGRVLQGLAQLVAIGAITSLLPAAEVGRNYLLLSLISWFSLVLVNPVTTYVGRNLLEWNALGKASGYYRMLGGYVLCVATVAAIAASGLNQTTGLGVFIEVPALLWLVLGGVLLGASASTTVTGLNILGRRTVFVLFSNLIAWGGVGLSVVFVRGISPSAESWVAGMLTAQALVSAAAAWLLLRCLSPGSQSRAPLDTGPAFSLTAVLPFAWPLSASVGFFWLQSEGYRFVLSGVAGEAMVGRFAASYAIGAGLMIAYETVFNQYYQPIYYRAITGRDAGGRAAAWNEYASAYLPTIVPVAVFVALGGPLLLRLIVAEQFQGSAVVVAMAVATEAFRMVSASYYNVGLAQRDMRMLILPVGTGALVALAGVSVLARWDPLVGTGEALGLAAMAVMVLSWASARRELPIELPWRRIALGAALAIPMGALYWVPGWVAFDPGKTQAVMIIGTASIYLLATQYVLARRWIYQGLCS